MYKYGKLGSTPSPLYDTAAQMTPRAPGLIANLQFARNSSQGTDSASGLFDRGLETLSLNEWTFMASSAVLGGPCDTLPSATQACLETNLEPLASPWVAFTTFSALGLGALLGE